MNFDKILQKVIVVLFCLLFFLVPLFFTSANSELFEFNKIVLVYGFTVLIVGAWISRMLIQKKIIFNKTPFFVPLVLFALSQIVSTIFSIDPHTSIFGYYSRFNGGLLSILSYLLLFWALVSNCETKNVFLFLKVSFVAAAIISVYGILEHFGHSFSCLMFTGKFDVACWVQDVKSRVFATIGQPNWLAAYLAILIPVAIGFFFSERVARSGGTARQAAVERALTGAQQATGPVKHIILSLVFFLCLLFTGSRSGFAGLAVGLAVFWILVFLINHQQFKSLIKPFLILNSSFLILLFILGSPFSQINRYFSLESLRSHFSLQSPASHLQLPTSNPGPQLEVGGSESGAIRKIVWKGAIDIFKNYPLFGSGVETFAYSYYNFRPIEHNNVSEWDFLYNKAHNEYLNFLSTTGILGLGTYLIFIVAFIAWILIQFKVQGARFAARRAKCKVEMQNSKLEKQKLLTFNCNFELLTLNFALFSGWLSILVSNFFGFSVVVVSLYTFLIPAFAFILTSPLITNHQSLITNHPSPKPLPLLAIFLAICYLLIAVLNLWRADYYYSIGSKLNKQNQFLAAYQSLLQATNLSPQEPVFLSEFSSSTANLAILSWLQKEATSSNQLTELAIKYSDKAIKISPKNLNLWKTRVKVFYTLSTIDTKYLSETEKSLLVAGNLAPTDPKIVLNRGLIYTRTGQLQEGLKLIQKAIEMKPDYEEARNDLAILYEEMGQKDKAVEQLKYIVEFIRRDDPALKERIDKLQMNPNLK